MTPRLPHIVLVGLLAAAPAAGPGAPSLAGQTCPPGPASPGADRSEDPALHGRVRDETRGVPVPGARVEARWTEGGDRLTAERTTDPDGRFRLCGIPSGTGVLVSAEAGRGPGARVRVTAGSGETIGLAVPLPAPGESSGLLGRIREAGSKRPVAAAEVRLSEPGRSTSTDGGGTFVFEDVAPGSYRLEIDHLSYGTVTDTVHLVAGRPLRMRFTLAPAPIRLVGVEAAARSRTWLRDRAALRRRIRKGFGDFITRDEIVRRGEPPLHFLLDAVPGVRAGHVSHPWGRTYYPAIRSCGIPRVYVDGARVAVEPAAGVGIDDFASGDIEVVEVYKGPAGAPREYSGVVGAGCGVILIWTRTPG